MFARLFSRGFGESGRAEERRLKFSVGFDCKKFSVGFDVERLEEISRVPEEGSSSFELGRHQIFRARRWREPAGRRSKCEARERGSEFGGSVIVRELGGGPREKGGAQKKKTYVPDPR